MGRRSILCFFSVAIFVIGVVGVNSARAYVQTLTSGGIPVSWPGGFKFNLAGNPANSSGLSDSQVFDSVVHSFRRWQEASQGTVQFDYWQGRDPKIYEPNSNYNGLSSVYFASNANGPTGLTPSILGLTQVWYSSDKGKILEADTVLNDHDFVFTEDPHDSSGFGSGMIRSMSYPRGKNHVYVENVLTHEFGHSLGLSHSGTLQSSMLYMESPEQAHLSCDEQTAMHALYPSGDAGSRGAISGTVTGPSGAPVFGASVVAISRRRGTLISGTMTNSNGSYTIAGLEPGDYFLMAEPYFAGPQPLPGYYSGMNSEICPDRDNFGRTFLVDSSGYHVLPVNVGPGSTASAPAIQVACNHGRAAVSGPSSASDPTATPEIFNGERESGFGATDLFQKDQPHYYRLSNISGHLEIHAISYSLYSPIRLDLQLLDSSGASVSARVESPVYEGDSGYDNFDSALIVDDLPAGDYVLEATPSTLGPEYYPAGQISLDSEPFALITGSMNESLPLLSETLPLNARCRMPENFAAYQSPPGLPPRAQTDSDSDGSGGCSILSISALGNDRGGHGGGPMSPGAVGWLIPWVAMLAVALRPWRLARR